MILVVLLDQEFYKKYATELMISKLISIINKEVESNGK